MFPISSLDYNPPSWQKSLTNPELPCVVHSLQGHFLNTSLTAGKKFTLQVHALPFLPLPLTGSSIM